MWTRFRRWREKVRAESALDDAVFRSIELSIDQMMRRGEATPENILQAVKEITDLYYGPPKTKKTPRRG
jgi:hypothetical protein